jgi:hypothetical protein
MFGFLKRRLSENKERLERHLVLIATEVAVVHERMRGGVPGAAYIFANVLHSARALLDDESRSIDQKITSVKAESDQYFKAGGQDADLGISGLAHTFVVHLLEAQRSHDAAFFTMSATFGDVAKHGAAYRELEERDERPPLNSGAQRILDKGGHRCLADVIRRLKAEHAAKGGDGTGEAFTLLALFDLRDEAESGRLSPYLEALQQAVLKRV